MRSPGRASLWHNEGRAARRPRGQGWRGLTPLVLDRSLQGLAGGRGGRAHVGPRPPPDFCSHRVTSTQLQRSAERVRVEGELGLWTATGWLECVSPLPAQAGPFAGPPASVRSELPLSAGLPGGLPLPGRWLLVPGSAPPTSVLPGSKTPSVSKVLGGRRGLSPLTAPRPPRSTLLPSIVGPYALAPAQNSRGPRPRLAPP